MKFKDVLDGTGKPPRDIQLDYFAELEKVWKVHRRFAMSGPPGVGKSFIARTIQRALPNTAIITTNNALVDQYRESYPELNGLKGKDYYETVELYKQAKILAKTKDTIFNPLSFYYFYKRNEDLKKPTTIIVDEAHKLAGMLMLIVMKSFPCKYYGIPTGLSEVQFMEWLGTMVAKMAPVSKLKNPTKSQEKLLSRYESLALLHDYLKNNLDNVRVAYEIQKNYRGLKQLCLTVTPLEFPHGLIETIFGKAKIILLSGTVTQFDLKELFPKDRVHFVSYEPLAPTKNRMVYNAMLPMSERRNIQTQAELFLQAYNTHKRPNTMVHLSYRDAPVFAAALLKLDKKLPILTHSKDDKEETIEAFKKKGGILLGSGMAEGVDLPGDKCRLLVIPRLLYPNKGDSAVQKRLNMEGGQLWYQLETMMTTIQQLGRGVRGVDDWCVSYVFDPTFPKLVQATQDYLTEGFKESIKCQEAGKS